METRLTEEQAVRVEVAIAKIVFAAVYTQEEYQERERRADMPGVAYLDKSGGVHWKKGSWKPAKYPSDWFTAEQFMLRNAKPKQKRMYVLELVNLLNPPGHEYAVAFSVATAPLPLRCLAFLSAMGENYRDIMDGR